MSIAKLLRKGTFASAEQARDDEIARIIHAPDADLSAKEQVVMRLDTGLLNEIAKKGL